MFDDTELYRFRAKRRKKELFCKEKRTDKGGHDPGFKGDTPASGSGNNSSGLNLNRAENLMGSNREGETKKTNG